MERRLSPTPPREPENVEAEAEWEFDMIPVAIESAPKTLEGGWEPVQIVTGTPGKPFLFTRRRIG